jgi:hypothetical protein
MMTSSDLLPAAVLRRSSQSRLRLIQARSLTRSHTTQWSSLASRSATWPRRHGAGEEALEAARASFGL